MGLGASSVSLVPQIIRGVHIQQRHTGHMLVQLWAYRLLKRSQMPKLEDIVFTPAEPHVDGYGR